MRALAEIRVVRTGCDKLVNAAAAKKPPVTEPVYKPTRPVVTARRAKTAAKARPTTAPPAMRKTSPVLR